MLYSHTGSILFFNYGLFYFILCTDPGFQVRGGGGGGGRTLKQFRRAECGANIFGVFRVKNHDFTPKKSCFQIIGRAPGFAPEIYVSLFVNQ